MLLINVADMYGPEENNSDILYCNIIQLLDRRQEALTTEINSALEQEKVSALKAEQESGSFLREQVNLLRVPKEGRRYTERTMALSEDFHARSPAGYRFMKKVLALPSVSTLNVNAAPFRCQPGVDTRRLKILVEETKHLCGMQRIFQIEFDEIHNKKKIEYKSGQVTLYIPFNVFSIFKIFEIS